MARRTFADVIRETKIDIKHEYFKLYNMFYGEDFEYQSVYLYEACSEYFLNYPFRGTCTTLYEFEQINDLHFYLDEKLFSQDYFIQFCEYTYNLTKHIKQTERKYLVLLQTYKQQIDLITEKIGYEKHKDSQTNVYIFVPKLPEAIAVSEIIEPALSYKVIEYNHHSMKGDLTRKRETLLKFADLLEARRQELKSVSSSLDKIVFSLFNNINIRHNNSDPQSGKYHIFVAEMSDEELEKWYDDTYQLCLLCFLEMDNVERKRRIKELNKNIKNADQ